jgi:RNA recognition motif-containing protein
VKNIYVGNLEFDTTEDWVRSLFEAHGAVETVTLVRDRDTGHSRGFAFVEMTKDSEAGTAIKALNGTLLGERRLNLNEARPKLDRGDRNGPPGQRQHRQHHI